MARIIQMPLRRPGRDDGIIASTPLEFRKGQRPSLCFIQVPREKAPGFETCSRGGCGGHPVAGEAASWGWDLVGGRENTILALFVNRGSEEKMRLVYYLAGLVDCMINQVNPLLRTDLLRSLYKKVFELKQSLGVDWSGRLDSVLLPIEPLYFSEERYRDRLQKAETMKELYGVIDDGTGEMFRLLGERYVFYCPAAGGKPWKTKK